MLFLFSLFSLGLIFSLNMGNVSAANNSSVYVSIHGNDNWDGLNSTHISGNKGPKATIENATSIVETGGIVHIANGNYSENNIEIKTNMTIIGENEQNTIINGINDQIFIVFTDVNVTITDLTLANGTNSNGGAIYNEGALNVKNCKFKDNTATGGDEGGIGGAIYNIGFLAVTDTVFMNNTANSGGAIYSYDTLTVNNSSFIDNSADNFGGAITDFNSLTITNSTFTKNSAVYGGAIDNRGSLTLTNINFNGNAVTYEGGAIENDGTLDVTCSNFIGNTANYAGGAILNYGDGNVNFNRIIGNTARIGSAIYGGPLDATLNWWGSNNGDFGGLLYDGEGGTVNFDPWIILTVNVNPNKISGGSSTITADLTHDSNYDSSNSSASYHDPASGHIPDNIPVTFNPGLMGILTATNVNVSSGRGSTKFTGTKSGISIISVTLDGFTLRDNITVINPVNHAPILNLIGNKTVYEGKMLNFKVIGSDLDNDPITFSATSLPSGASFNESKHTFTWIPTYFQSGVYNATFKVSDGKLIVKEIIKIMVKNVDRAPILTSIQNKTINEGRILNFTVNGIDPDRNALKYSTSNLPYGASFNKAKHTFTWTPTYSQSGIYNITFAVSDGKLINKETVKITVKNIDTFDNSIEISNRGTGKIYFNYKLIITETNGKVSEKSISGYLNAKTSKKVSCGNYKAGTKIKIMEYIYNKSTIRKNIDVINQIIVANKVVFQQRVQKQMVIPSLDNILYPVKL